MKNKLQIILIFITLMLQLNIKTTSQTVSTFESFNFGVDSVWNGKTQPLGTNFINGNASFDNYYDTAYGGMWASGWAISSMKDSTTSGYFNMYSSRTGSGYNSNTYIVGQQNAKIKLIGDAAGKIVNGFWVTNGTFAANSMKDGDGYAKKFGGTTGNDPDFFLLTIRKYFGGALAEEKFMFYLADYRFANNNQDYIVKDWKWVNLKSLGNVDSLVFELESSDVGPYGICTPLFFCIDNFTTSNSGVNVSEFNSNNIISIFPNPTTDILNINLSQFELETFEIEVFDFTGKLIYSKIINSKNNSILTSNFAKGIYQLRVKGKNFVENKTFIKK